MSRPTVVFITTPDGDEPPELEPIRVVADVIVVATADDLRGAQLGADAAFAWDFQTPLIREVGPGRLRWIHTNSIGVDAIMTPEVISAPVVVTNTRGVYEQPMGEYVLSLILYFAKDLGHTRDMQRAREWGHRQVDPIRERRVLILGPGAVGREITQMLRAAGMTVDVVGRRARDDEPGIGRVHALENLGPLLAQAQDIVVALPLTAETHGIVDAELLGQMRPGARLFNVGRGALIDEPALVESLRNGQLAAAALDVFDIEPLPVDHPFWSLDNVFVSPHMSSDVHGILGRAVEMYTENLKRWSSGQELLNVVDKQGFAVAAAEAPS